jgi:putative transposase
MDAFVTDEKVGEVAVAAPASMDEQIRRWAEEARRDGLQLVGEGGLLARMTKLVVESALEGEMDDHLGYTKHDPVGRDSGNSRNGKRAKTIETEAGPVEITVPRDRDASFSPQIVKKRQRRLNGVENIVISLSAKGLTTGEISAHLREIYGADVPKSTISTITDRVMEGMAEWQNRPLDPGRFPSVVANQLVNDPVSHPLIASMGVRSPRMRRGRLLSCRATS